MMYSSRAKVITSEKVQSQLMLQALCPSEKKTAGQDEIAGIVTKCNIKQENSVKNHADAMIFHAAVCAASVTNRNDRKTKSDIRLAIPPTQSVCKWRME